MSEIIPFTKTASEEHGFNSEEISRNSWLEVDAARVTEQGEGSQRSKVLLYSLASFVTAGASKPDKQPR